MEFQLTVFTVSPESLKIIPAFCVPSTAYKTLSLKEKRPQKYETHNILKLFKSTHVCICISKLGVLITKMLPVKNGIWVISLFFVFCWFPHPILSFDLVTS